MTGPRTPRQSSGRARLLAGLLGLQLCAVSWASGGEAIWAVGFSLVLALAAMVLALWPGQAAGSEPQETPRSEGRILQRFPLFWLGLTLLFYLLLQAANPSWQWEGDAASGALQPRSAVSWLPTSVRVPFSEYGLWRRFLLYATVWLNGCALWLAPLSRRTLQWLFGLLVCNGVLLGMLGFLQRSGAWKGGGKIELRAEDSAYASFAYRNQAGAYLGLIVAVALALAAWHYIDGRRRLARSTPAGVWLLGALLLAVAVVFSYSRGAILTVGTLLVISALAFGLLRYLLPIPASMPRYVTVALACVILTGVGAVVQQADMSGAAIRFESLFQRKGRDASYHSRVLLREQALAMWREQGLRGTGAGSFRYLFPAYVQRSESLAATARVWEHAHMDWLEIPIELGLIGVLLLTGAFGWCLRRWWILEGYRHPGGLLLPLGLGLMLVHAGFDYIFQSPAIVLTWWALLLLLLRWLETEAPEMSRRTDRAGR